MSNVKLLSPKEHRDLRVALSVGATYLHPVAKVIAGELHDLVRDYPVFITKNVETGLFELNAILGFEADRNLYLEDGYWRAETVPLNVMRHPFHAVPVGSGGAGDEAADFKLGIDLGSPSVNSSDGQALFTDSGSATAFLESATELLGRLIEGELSTQRFLEALAEQDLIVPAVLEVTFRSGVTRTLEGLYSIDRQRLSNLNAEMVHDFHIKGYLEAIFAILHSAGHVQKLINWHEGRDDTEDQNV